MTSHPRHANRREFLKTVGIGTAVVAAATRARGAKVSDKPKRPSILFCISDDQSWLHTSIGGCKTVKTPAFDRVAREGVLFNHCYCAAPSCTPSRGGLLTGQAIWRLEEGGSLFSTLPAKFAVYPEILEKAGYHVGYTGKGWGPGSVGAGGRKRNPAGNLWRKRRGYSANFKDFLDARKDGQPFCFWYGCHEPHRGYRKGSGLRSGKKLEDVDVPPFLVDTREVRSDILDYCLEIESYDKHLGQMLEHLKDAGELDSTLIVVTSDNGLPFPRCKCTVYDWGVRMPLAVRWGSRVKGARTVDDFISHVDMAPTFLAAAGLDIPAEMTGRSFLNVLLSEKSGRVDPKRDCVYTARERHTVCRREEDGGDPGYPSRVIRTHEYLYIHNYAPDRWPHGDPDTKSVHGYFFGDTDRGPTREEVLKDKKSRQFELCFAKRPEEELYDARKDPGQIHNLAGDPKYAEIKQQLRKRLDEYLKQTKDPRSEGKSPWDRYPYYLGNPKGLVPYSKYRKTKGKK